MSSNIHFFPFLLLFLSFASVTAGDKETESEALTMFTAVSEELKDVLYLPADIFNLVVRTGVRCGGEREFNMVCLIVYVYNETAFVVQCE
jgi:hypothetical protein